MAETVNQSSEGTIARVSVLEERVRALGVLIDERDRNYKSKFEASEVAVKTAIVASDKQTGITFAASEKAIVKAEEAQREYNVRSNEFRGQLDDQAKTLLPRLEAQTLFKSFEDKMNDLRKSIDLLRDTTKKDVSDLREYRSQASGKGEGMNLVIMFLVGLIGPAVAILAIFLKR